MIFYIVDLYCCCVREEKHLHKAAPTLPNSSLLGSCPKRVTWKYWFVGKKLWVVMCMIFMPPPGVVVRGIISMCTCFPMAPGYACMHASQTKLIQSSWKVLDGFGWRDSLVVSALDQRPQGRRFESNAGRWQSHSNRGPVALCTLGLGLLNPPSFRGR